MNGLSKELLASLRETLLRCGPFESDQSVKVLFLDSRIYQWRSRLQDATSANARVLSLINVLVDQENGDGENALALFINVLQDEVSEHDKCNQDYARLLKMMEGQNGRSQPQESHLPQPTPPPSTLTYQTLPQYIRERFSKADLDQLLFKLGTSLEDIPGETIDVLAIETVRHFDRRGQLDKLIDAVLKERPN